MRAILLAALALTWGAASFEAGWRLAHAEKPATFDDRFGDWPKPSPFGSGPIRQYA
jgi:hypothetical protein